MPTPNDASKSNPAKGNVAGKADMPGDSGVGILEKGVDAVEPLYPTPYEAQISWDFEDGSINGWNLHPLGNAFSEQPIRADSITIPAVQRRRDLVPLGGDYWQNSRYPLITGNQGVYLIASSADSVGSMIYSNNFRINCKYILFLCGGLEIPQSASGSYAELLVKETKEEAWNRAMSTLPSLIDPITGSPVHIEPEFTSRLSTPINNTNGVMTRTSWLVDGYMNRIAFIRIIDYTRGRVLVDDFRFE